MAVVLKAVSYADGRPCKFEGQYLERYDPDIADERDVMAEFTDDLSRAMKFADAGAALTEWNRVRTIDPVRADGKPNKPLTALTMLIETVEREG